MRNEVYLTPLRFFGWIFVGTTMTWLFWNGVFGIARFIITGAFP